MIEISHRQARYLLREAEDKRLPEEQWAALQAHLESCPECRAYREQMVTLEKDLHRELQARWSAARAPLEAYLPRQVAEFLTERPRRLRRARNILLAGLALVILVVLIWRGETFKPARSAPASQLKLAAAPSPTMMYTFRGLAAFTTRQSGNSEIYLLNATGTGQPDLTNLTNDPAEDTDPAWSPDGEWIAFLSNRTGKNEVYILSVAGTRLTQLTHDRAVEWQGPLSWEADGQYLALTGKRLDQNDAQWVYALPLNGGEAISLPSTRGAAGWARFSPSQPLLVTPGMVFDFSAVWSFSGWYGLPTVESSSSPSVQSRVDTAGPGIAADWVLGGNSLVYLAQAETTAANAFSPDQVRLSPVLGLNNRASLAPYLSLVVARSTASSPFRSMSYMPGGPWIATLQDTEKKGCWTVQLFHVIRYEQLPQIALTGFCVEGPLERASWMSSGPARDWRWLVVSGRQANAAGDPVGAPGIYAMRIATNLAQSAPAEFQRLADLPASGVADPLIVPRVRPSEAFLNIQPLPVAPRKVVLPAGTAASEPPPPRGGILLVEPDPASAEQYSAIIRMQPGDGAGRSVLLPADAVNTCPAWSPDGEKIAFISDRGGGQSEVFTMDPDGSHLNQLTLVPPSSEGAAPMYGCPVWSPDSQVLAVVQRAQEVPAAQKSSNEQGAPQDHLLLIGRTQGVLRMVPIADPSNFVGPVWSPDGEKIYLVQRGVGGSAASPARPVVIVTFASRKPEGGSICCVLKDWEDVRALSISPDGKWLALIVMKPGAEPGHELVSLFVISTIISSSATQVDLPAYNLQGGFAYGRIAWLPDGDIIFPVSYGPLESAKAEFKRFSPVTKTITSLTFSQDTLYDWAWKDNWLFYSSESGLWGQAFFGGENWSYPRTQPKLWSDGEYLEIDWH